MKQVAGLGEILWDLYPDKKRLGGAPANAAIHAQRLGAKAVIASAVGVDKPGDEIIRMLNKLGIETQYIQHDLQKPTGTVGVTLDKNGIPSFACSGDTAFDHMHWNAQWAALAASSDAVIFGTLAQRNEASRETVQQFLDASAGMNVFDVNVRVWKKWTETAVMQSLPKADILKVNEEELAYLKEMRGQATWEDGTFLAMLVSEYNLKLAALSLGAQGCMLTDGRDRIRMHGIPVDVRDTTGCGDAFAAALTLRYLAGDDLEHIARWANGMGALVATKKGAVPEFSMDEIQAFFDRTKARKASFRVPNFTRRFKVRYAK